MIPFNWYDALLHDCYYLYLLLLFEFTTQLFKTARMIFILFFQNLSDIVTVNKQFVRSFTLFCQTLAPGLRQDNIKQLNVSEI